MIQFKVKNKETGKIVSPKNYYFVIKQNGELYTLNGSGYFKKADDKYEILSEPTTKADTSKAKLNIGGVSNSVNCDNCKTEIKITDKHICKECFENGVKW